MNQNQNNRLELSIHMLIWMVLFFLPATFTIGTERNWMEIFSHFWLQLIFIAIIFYVNYFIFVKWLFSRERNKKILFFAANLLLLLIVTYLKNEFMDLMKPERMVNAANSGKKDFGPPPAAFRYYLDFLIYLIPVAFSIAVKSGKRIRDVEEMKREADNIKLKSELQHLKFQLQPHFFFNALNNIYSLVDISPDKAKTSIHNLSKLMRHLLYKSEMEKVSLADEIDFLNKYIELMSLRLNDNTKVITDFPSHIPDVKVIPLLFISIVENAFKHGVSATEPSDIFFKINIQEGEILFIASNSNFPKDDTDRSGSGIGVDNLKKRLSLLYPESHEYNNYLNNNIYIAEIKLKID
ncbi:histidine kinase [Chryseobacterium sp.]|uniref:sensor histidine kinase n=1 Tax=Chryseobacterium sp. TaxID=1871047 RepID=UPI0025BD78E4|nr:histidine kinase [Chryseobacterium sp.]